MTTVAAIVEPHQVEKLVDYFVTNGWEEGYVLIDNDDLDESGAEPLSSAPSLVIDPGIGAGATGPVGAVFVSNIQDRLADLDLDDDEKQFYARRVAEGGTLVAVDVDDDNVDQVQRRLSEAGAQQMQTAS